MRLGQYLTLHLISLFILIIILNEGDLTNFSLTYQAKVCGISVLLFVGTSLFVAESSHLQQLKNWQYAASIASISNLIFLPLLKIISQKESLSLWLPALVMLCFVGLWGLTFRSKTLWKALLKLRPQPAASFHTPLTEHPNDFFSGKTILLHGATSVMGRTFLARIESYKLQKLLLLDNDLIQLEMLIEELGKAYPELETHLFSSVTLTQQTVKSIFNSYKPDIVLDFGRYFCSPTADGGLASFLKINALIPYWLVNNAYQSGTALMLSLQPELIGKDKIAQESQDALTTVFQQLDSSKLRVVMVQTPLLVDDSGVLWYARQLHKLAIKQTVCVQAPQFLTDIVDLGKYLICNPVHHGSVWHPLFAKKLSFNGLKTILKTHPGDLSNHLALIPDSKVQAKNLITTDHSRLAIITREFLSVSEADAYFHKLETVLQENPSDVEAHLNAA
ncbi:hypothetical protein [Candidatus Paracaedibacter symbiosus]|uniref:hypothetical protein n=1 Tax=Candidatus Paracaedibacter symbiosus TaxID=244582 RepID=UPI0012EBA1EA|nr:hypothetical protein [Candidatus Paracaedibacter symbiosus]